MRQLAVKPFHGPAIAIFTFAAAGKPDRVQSFTVILVFFSFPESNRTAFYQLPHQGYVTYFPICYTIMTPSGSDVKQLIPTGVTVCVYIQTLTISLSNRRVTAPSALF